MSEINDVETEGKSVSARFPDPDRYGEIPTPDRAEEAAQPVSENAEVQTGREEDGDDLEVQSVLADEHAGEGPAEEQARGIVDRIES